MSVCIFSLGIALPLTVLPLAGSGKISIGHRPGWLMPPLKGPARPEIGESGVHLQGLGDFLLSIQMSQEQTTFTPPPPSPSSPSALQHHWREQASI